IKRDAFPEVDMDKLMITTRYPGASAEDVELNVTNKLETELKGVDDIDEMTSYSMENISVINVTLEPDADDKEQVKRDIRDAVSRVPDLPQEVTEAPYIYEITTENLEVIWVGITGDQPYAELRRLAKAFEKKLENIRGVSRVSRNGLLDREIRVEVSEDAMDEYQISLREFVSAIQGRNIRATGGSFESYTSDKSIVTMAQFRDPKEAGDVIIRSSFGGPYIQVKDLAKIVDDFEPEKTRFRMNGRTAIGFTVYKNGNADIIRVIDAVKELVAQEQALMPDGVELMVSSDMSRFVRNRLGIMADNGLIGLLLVCVVLFVFLSFRTAFWVAMGIPLTMMGVVFLAPMFGVFIELISLMGMVIVIGLVVDDAIVVAENIHRHHEMGKAPIEAAVDGAHGVLKPVAATIVTTAMAFGTMFFMTGVIGKFIFPVPLAIILALVVSVFEALTILPAHIASGLRNREKRLARKGIDGTGAPNVHGWYEKVRNRFQRFMVHLLALRYAVVTIFVAALVGAVLYANYHMHFILFPGNVADQFYVTVELPTGSSLDATSDKVKEIEELLTALPENELNSYITHIGSQGGGSWMFMPGESENWALIAVTLTPFSERQRGAQEIVAGLRALTDSLQGFDVIRYTIDAGGPPVGRPIVIRVVGADDEMRTSLSDSVFSYLSSLEGVSDVSRDDKLGKDQVEILVNHQRLAELGLSVADIAHNVRLAYDGQVVTRVRYGDEDVGFRVILEEARRKRPGYLGQLKVPNKQGRLIPLNQVAGFETGPGPSKYFHWDGERTVTITADLATGGMTPLQATLATVDNFDLNSDWPGMRFVIGGEAQETQESIVNLGVTMVLAAVGIYFVLILLFNSVWQPIIVMLAIPFGLIGVIGAFALHGEPLGFLAVLGLIGMMGVVVNDSLILVNYINFHRQEDPEKSLLRIVAEGTSTRLRPILLTSITTVAGVLPLAYGLGGSDPFISPMAMALGYGILFATPLTLILMPCFYMVQNDISRAIAGICKFCRRER
ncbi:MAG: efflux RND transporter permease subunit, partial [Candidatus Zixiibacteriota bacterium]